MNRNELVRSLKLLLEATYTTDEYRVKEIKARKLLDAARTAQPKNVKKNKIGVGDVIAALFCALLLGGAAFLFSYAAVFLIKLVSNLLFNTYLKLISQSTLFTAIALGVLFALAIFFVVINHNKKRYEEEYIADKEYNEQMEYLNKNFSLIKRDYESVKRIYLEKKSNLDVLCAKFGLHQDYCEPWTIKWIIDILEHGRADSLKEAINLYEQESHQAQRELDESRERIRQRQMEEQQLQELQAIRSENERAANAAEEASRSADDAAFWSAATAYLVDKRTKK